MVPFRRGGAGCRHARLAGLAQYYELTKPRVVQLIVFCALIGMVLAVPGVPSWAQAG
jgi:heme O synthase-like polyprenyltransferase